MILFNLDINGVSVSGGSACTSGSNIGSHVLAELDRDQARGAVRFSFSKYNTEEEVDYAVEKLVWSDIPLYIYRSRRKCKVVLHDMLGTEW
jgi:cysteine sulfinate desulfinase/cysteine desulfurase-like protein